MAALVAHPPCLVMVAGDSSEELEGASPKWCGLYGEQVVRPAHKRTLRWLLRRINGLNRQGKHELPSGSSYDSLSELESRVQPTEALSLQQPDWQLRQQQHPHHGHFQQPEQLQQPEQQQPEQQQQQPRWRRAVRALLRPIVHMLRGLTCMDPGSNDHSVAERVTNVITSVPFFVLGLNGLRQRKCPKGRHFCLAFMAVGVVASLYHGVGVSSPIRPVMRKMDYYTIAYTSNVLRRAAHIPLPRCVQLGSLLLAPWKPTAVTGLNLALVESKYVRAALSHAHLRPSLKLHFSTAAAGLLCFALEDVATLHLGWPPVLHSLWHCLSAVAMACTNSLLAHLEMVLLVEGVQVAGP